MAGWTSGDSEQRSEYRIAGRVVVDLQVADGVGDEPPRWLRCRTRDISASGLSITADKPVVESALLNLKVTIDNTAVHALLAEVRSCQEWEDGFWRIGLVVMDTGDNSLPDWKEAVATLLDG
ncbi:MAG: PilZ domain-containing protein [Pseudomonadota bacterium]